jgi:hypothetical protein
MIMVIFQHLKLIHIIINIELGCNKYSFHVDIFTICKLLAVSDEVSVLPNFLFSILLSATFVEITFTSDYKTSLDGPGQPRSHPGY